MSQLKIATNVETGFSAYIDNSTGEAFLTDSLICRLTGIDNKSLNGIIESQGLGNHMSNYPEVFTLGGLQGVGNLRKASDLKVILRAWNPTKPENKARKEELIDAMLDAGTTTFVYNLCGYSMQPVVQPSTTRVLNEFEVIEMVDKANSTYLNIQNGMAQYDVRLAQICIDRLIQAVNANQTLLPASNEPQLSGCVEIGTKLGYNVGKEDRGLGRYVAKAWRNAYSSEPLKAKREVGGAMRDVGVYPSDDPVVTSAIKEYYAKRTAKL